MHAAPSHGPLAAPLWRPRVPPECSPTLHSLRSRCAPAQLQATQPHAAPLFGPTLRPCAVLRSPPARSPSAFQRSHTQRPRCSQCAQAQLHMLHPCSVTRCAPAPAKPHAGPQQSPTLRRCAAVAPQHNPKQHNCVAAPHSTPARCPAAPMHIPTLPPPPTSPCRPKFQPPQSEGAGRGLVPLGDQETGEQAFCCPPPPPTEMGPKAGPAQPPPPACPRTPAPSLQAVTW